MKQSSEVILIYGVCYKMKSYKRHFYERYFRILCRVPFEGTASRGVLREAESITGGWGQVLRGQLLKK